MATVLDIINDALAEIGVNAVNIQTPANDAAFALHRFHNQLDAWRADKLTLFNFQRTTYAWPASTQSQTIGPSGNIVTTSQPVYVNGINYVVPGSSPPVETPMGPMDPNAFQNLSIKTLSSSLPTEWFFNPGPVNATLTIWPVPSQIVTLAIYSFLGFTSPAGLTDVLVGPAGYQEAFMYQLALRLCNAFGRQVPPLLPQFASEAYARVKRTNQQPPLMGVDAALVPMVGGAYNVLNDQYTGYAGVN